MAAIDRSPSEEHKVCYNHSYYQAVGSQIVLASPFLPPAFRDNQKAGYQSFDE